MIKRIKQTSSSGSILKTSSTEILQQSNTGIILDNMISKDLDNQYENYNRLQKKNLKNNLNDLYKDFQYFKDDDNNENQDSNFYVNCNNTQFQINEDSNLSSLLWLCDQFYDDSIKFTFKFQPKIFGNLQQYQYSEIFSMFDEDYTYGNFDYKLNDANFGILDFHYNNDNNILKLNDEHLYNTDIVDNVYKPFIWKIAQGFSLNIQNTQDSFKIFTKISKGAILQKVINVKNKDIVDIIPVNNNEQHLTYNYLPEMKNIITNVDLSKSILNVQVIFEKMNNNVQVKHTLILSYHNNIQDDAIFVTQSIVYYDIIKIENNDNEIFILPNKYIGKDYDDNYIENLLSSNENNDNKISIYKNGVAIFNKGSNVNIDYMVPFSKLQNLKPPFAFDVMFKLNKDPQFIDSLYPRLFELRKISSCVGNLNFDIQSPTNYGKPVYQNTTPSSHFFNQQIFNDYNYVFDKSQFLYALYVNPNISSDIKLYIENYLYKPIFWNLKSGFFFGFNNNSYDENNRGKLFVDMGCGLESIGSFDTYGNIFNYDDIINELKIMLSGSNITFPNLNQNAQSIVNNDYKLEKDKWYICRFGMSDLYYDNLPSIWKSVMYLNIFDIENNKIIIKNSTSRNIDYKLYFPNDKDWGFNFDYYGRTQSINVNNSGLSWIQRDLEQTKTITLQNVLQYQPDHNLYQYNPAYVGGGLWEFNIDEFTKYVKNKIIKNNNVILTDINVNPTTILNSEITTKIVYVNFTTIIPETYRHIFKTEPTIIKKPSILIGAHQDKEYQNDLDSEIAEYRFYNFNDNNELFNFVNDEDEINKDYNRLNLKSNNNNLLYQFVIDDNNFKDQQENNLELKGNYKINNDNPYEPLYAKIDNTTSISQE